MVERIRPEDVKRPLFGIAIEDGEVEEHVIADAIQAAVGRLGLSANVIVVDPTPQVEELLPFDPEKDGTLGAITYQEFEEFMIKERTGIPQAAFLWLEYSKISASRAVNNDFYATSADTREARDYHYAGLEKARQNLYANPSDAVSQQQEDLLENRISKIEGDLCELYRETSGKHCNLSELRDILNNLKEPTAMGQPFIFYGQPGPINPATGKPEPGEAVCTPRKGRHHNVSTWADLDVMYQVFTTPGESSAGAYPGEGKHMGKRMRQLQTRLFNSRIKDLT